MKLTRAYTLVLLAVATDKAGFVTNSGNNE